MAEKPNEKVNLCTVNCSIHHEEYYCNFCEECNVLACPSCLVELHQRHQLRKLIDVYHEEIKQIETNKELINKDLLIVFKRRTDKLDEIKELHLKQYSEEKLKIEKCDANLKDEITKRTNKLLEELKITMEKTQREITKEKTRIDKIIEELTEEISKVNDAKTSKNIETIHNVDKKLEDCLKSVNTNFAVLPIQCKQYIEGRITDNRLSKAVGSLKNFLLPCQADFQVKRMYETNFGEIGSISTNDDGTLWLSDWWGEFSNNIYHIKMTNQLNKITEKKMYMRCHLAVTKTGDVLVMNEKDTTIKLLCSDGTLKNFHTFPGGFFHNPQVPTAIHVMTNGRVLVSTAEKSYKYTLHENSRRQVYMFSSLGKDIACFEFNNSGKRLFTIPFKLTSSEFENKELICIVDRISFEKGRIVTLNRKGKPLWTYEGQKEKSLDPYDITMTLAGNIIVSDVSHKDFHILNCDGHIIQQVQSEKLGLEMNLLPSILVDKDGQLLIVCGSKIHVIKFTGC